MQAIFRKRDGLLDYYNSGSALTNGAIVVIGTIVGSVNNLQGIAAGEWGTLVIDGHIDGVKASGAWTAGDSIYWDADGSPNGGVALSGAFTTTASGNTLAGVCEVSALTGAATGRILLTSSQRTATLAGSLTADDITAGDAILTIGGLQAAQGGSIPIVGGTSTTSTNAGGAVSLTGGVGTTTAVGGAASLVGGAGTGAAVGGAASVTGGLGGSSTTVGVGGAATVTAGAGQATAAGGVASVVGGASGSGATGNGGAANVTGGAAASTNGSGGSVILTPGAKAGSGIAGGVFLRSSTSQIWRQQVVSTAESDGAQAVAAADMINGICVFTLTTGRTLTTPTGAALLAVCPAAIAAGDSFDFTVITVGSGSDDIATLTAGDGDITFVGPVTVGGTTGHGGTGDVATWRFRYTGANAFVGYRIA